MRKDLLIRVNIMSHLLLHATASVATRTAFVQGLPSARRAIGLLNGRDLCHRSIIQPVGSCKPITHHFTTLQSADASVEDSESSAQQTKQKSRKQRQRKSKAINLQRVDKVLAHRGVGTRSQTFQFAKSKRIAFASTPDAPFDERTRIRGPKDKVPFDANIFLDGTLLPGPAPLLLAYNKPKYVLSVMEDDKKYADQERKHLGQVLEPRFVKSGMHPVGRLDYDTTGLILFSLDGQLTQRLLHPRRGVEKEYLATVQGIPEEGELREKLSVGVETAAGVHKAKLVAVDPSDGPTDGDELFDSMLAEDDDNKEDIDLDYSGKYSDVRLIVSEGKHRMVRRMLANCGHPVAELRRLRHGEIQLGDLKEGEFREATEEELEWARSLIN